MHNNKQPLVVVLLPLLVPLCFMAFWITSVIRMGVWHMALFALPVLAILVINFVRTVRNYLEARDDADGFSTLPDEATRDGEDADYRPYGGGPAGNRFCPYCGAAVLTDFTYCNSCGRKLPQLNKQKPTSC